MTSEEIAELRQKKYNCQVVKLQMVHSDLMLVRLKPDFPMPAHKPGQYCSLGLGFWEPRTEGCQEETLTAPDHGKVVRRAYSISHPMLDDDGALVDPSTVDYLEFYIVLVRENTDGRVPALTPRIFALKEGDRLNMGERITGAYTLDPVKPTDTVLFLATGTGEAPHNYMLWERLRQGHTGRSVSVCCVRYARDLAYRDSHRVLMEGYPHYAYVPLVTREATDGRKVYIQDLLTSGELERIAGVPLDPESTHVFLCGNPQMIGVPVRDKETGERSYPTTTGVIELLEKRGFHGDAAGHKERGNIHFEEYW